MNDLRCPGCGETARTGPVYPARCRCGELWRAAARDVYAAFTAGARATPLWDDPVEPDLLWKREDLQPTGSFKDRGARVLAALARERGAQGLVVDSSGSAALAAAAAGAAGGLPVTVHTPGSLPTEKRDALDLLGARVVAEGTRSDAAHRAAGAAADAFHASHVYHPAFAAGTAGSGLEVLETLGDAVPRRWVLPVGNGSLLLGLAAALQQQGRGDVRLIAVQSEACPGLRRPGAGGSTRAYGIDIADPPRRDEILEALGGEEGVLEVSEAEIERGARDLSGRGVWAETTSGAALAGVRVLRERGVREPVLAWLTGSGLRGGS